MRLHILEISQFEDKLSDDEKILMIYLGNLYTDINILLKTCVCSRNTPGNNDVVNVAQFSQTFFFFEVLAGKILEGWKIIQQKYNGSKLSQEYHKALKSKDIQNYRDLKSYFKGSNKIKDIRNRYAFHYDNTLSGELLAKFNDSNKDELKIYLSEKQGNCYFHFAESIMLRSLIEDDINKPDQIYDEITEIANKLLKFIFSFFSAVIKIHNIELPELENIDMPETPSFQEVTLPYFLEK